MRSGRMRLWKLMAEPKKSGPCKRKTRACAPSLSSTSFTSLAADQANARALMKRPMTTAVAKSTAIVTPVTTRMTSASVHEMMESSPKDPHANVLIDTMNMSPTNAATGMWLTSGVAKTTLTARPAAMIKLESRPWPPPLTLISDWPIKAQPPCVPKSPATMFPRPCPKHSRLVDPGVPVIWSSNLTVNKLSTKPTSAIRHAVVITAAHMSMSPQSTPAGGKLHEGSDSRPLGRIVTSARVRGGNQGDMA
mmetsp:Transcript_42161/g.127385  ORF Transcript_42161/g.127385 Transcript_42161/m.127385 type:complete len:250 (+) Transcript_42161:428-1177(+)